MFALDPAVKEALQLLLAQALGAAVGLERRLRGHPAGIHTNALVSLGSDPRRCVGARAALAVAVFRTIQSGTQSRHRALLAACAA